MQPDPINPVTLAELDTWLGLSAIKAALNPTTQTMPLSLGQIAYEAYCESRTWRSLTNELLPPWHDQSPELKTAWDAAAHAVKANLSPSDATTSASPHSG